VNITDEPGIGMLPTVVGSSVTHIQIVIASDGVERFSDGIVHRAAGADADDDRAVEIAQVVPDIIHVRRIGNEPPIENGMGMHRIQ